MLIDRPVGDLIEQRRDDGVTARAAEAGGVDLNTHIVAQLDGFLRLAFDDLAQHRRPT
jgi:hypothetical protein